MAQSAMGIALTDVNDEAKLPLGFIHRKPADRDNSGEQEWVYVKNDDSSDWAAGEIIVRSAGEVIHAGVQASGVQPATRVLGVAQHAIPEGEYGFILRKGLGEVLAGSAGLSADAGVVSGGSADGSGLEYAAASSGHQAALIAWATEAATSTNTATCWLDCRGS